MRKRTENGEPLKLKKLNIIYVSPKDSPIENVEFYAWLKHLDNCRLEYEFRSLNAETQEQEDLLKLNDEIVYLNLPAVILLPKIKNRLAVLKQDNCFLIAGGGPDIAIHYQEIFTEFPEIDAVIINPEIEKVLEQLAGECIDDPTHRQMQGVAYRNMRAEEKCKIRSGPALSENLDHLSSIELFDHWNPKREWYPIIVSRGCQYECRYCGFQLPYLQSFANDIDFRRIKSAKKVGDEIAFLHSKGVKKFLFYCHQFFSHREKDANHIRNICEEILNRNLDIQFRFSTKPSLLLENIDQMDILKKAGLTTVDIGIDSGIARFHEMYRTGSTVQDCIDVLKYMHKNTLSFDTGFIFYDPYLTVAEMKENLLFLEEGMSCYSHLSKPFSAYLDSCILNTALILRYGMPIIEKLRADNLISEEPGFVANPIAKFSNRDVISVYSIYRAVNELFLKKIRHLFYDQQLVQAYPFINRFPITMYEEILSAVGDQKCTDIKGYTYHIVDFIKDSFRPYLGEIFSRFPIYENNELKAAFEING
ncbi:MAG: radical SAM protein [Candidatus Aminicenantes bacterium]|nr:radical SAM protein [Candidatus Aminicenantes bacterium]